MPTPTSKYRPHYYPFGSSLNTRSFSAGSGFRFGFNGKENFDKYQDYGFRIYYPSLGKFLSTDPIIVFQQKYHELSSFQFASNTPICAIDLDGLEARIYVDVSGVGHVFISVIDDYGIINLYTYGQYGQGVKNGKSKYSGEGALVHLVGDAANKYIKDEFGKFKINVYEIDKTLINKDEIMKYYETEFIKYQQPAEPKQQVIKDAAFGKNDSKAVKYKNYKGIANEEDENNCVTVASDGLCAANSDLLYERWYPPRVNNYLSDLVKENKKMNKTWVTDETTKSKEEVEKNIHGDNCSKEQKELGESTKIVK